MTNIESVKIINMRKCLFRSLNSVIFVWLDSYKEDFHESPDYPCLHLLENFANEHAPGSGIVAKVKEVMSTFRQEDAELVGEWSQ